MMMPRSFNRAGLAGCCLLFSLFSCTKTADSPSVALFFYNSWVYTHSMGSISVNGNAMAVSVASNSAGNISVDFQQNGKYQYRTPLFDETDGFSLADSTVVLLKDSSNFANFCAFPVVSFISTPDIPSITLQHVSKNLQVIYISRDSLLLRTDQVKPGNNAPDTIYTEFTGFRRKA